MTKQDCSSVMGNDNEVLGQPKMREDVVLYMYCERPIFRLGDLKRMNFH